ncbi:MAG: hypothetical protein OSA37_00870 [Flavobacteriales bacterium]|nr:hypothetical protein [Flavobacteriales bacterium]
MDQEKGTFNGMQPWWGDLPFDAMVVAASIPEKPAPIISASAVCADELVSMVWEQF